jgi:hypothetical protein
MPQDAESTIPRSGLVTRRDAIAGGIATLVAGGAVLLKTPPALGVTMPGPATIQTGNVYTGVTSTTGVTGPVEGGPAFVASNEDALGQGLGVSAVGHGLALHAEATDGTGIECFGPVAGLVSVGNVGVRGEAYPAEGSWAGSVGVRAVAGNPLATALVVDGRASFSRSGRATISRGTSTRIVTVPGGLTASAMIFVTLQSSAGTGIYVRCARRVSSNQFQVMLNAQAKTSADAAWMVLG